MAGPPSRKVGLARALSKLGVCSRREAFDRIRAGRIRLNGSVVRDPEFPVDLQRDRMEADGGGVRPQAFVYVMLNKPRGLLTTTRDEQGRETVYACLASAHQADARNAPGLALPRVVAVGRLDKASEGLLLFTNDTEWADDITAPATHIDKTYHVQIACVPDDALLLRIRAGATHEGERLTVKRVTFLRAGDRHGWLEIVLDEGRNRHIRRMLEVLGVEVLRLVRIAVGSLPLGDLPKGQWRHLSSAEVAALTPRRSPPRKP